MVVNQTNILKIYLSALAAQVIDYQINSDLLAALANHNNTQEIARSFGDSRLIRQLYLKRNRTTQLPKLDINHKNIIIFGGQEIGQIQILYKNTIPGEIQAKLTVESAIDRFLEYLQKIYKIVVLDESDFHVKVFIPKATPTNFNKYWEEFIKNVAFSIYGDPKYNLPGLIHTFVSLLNTVKLSKRETGGFGILRVPIITEAQADIMAAWYYSIIIDKLSRSKLTDENKEEVNQIIHKYSTKYKIICELAKQFTSIAKNQINPTSANIKQMISEIYKLLGDYKFDQYPQPLLNEFPKITFARSPGDDTGEFCYACGINLSKKEKKWEALKIVFQSSTQRLQSSSGERQPRICSSCMCLSVASPLKLSHRNIILKLAFQDKNTNASYPNKINEYIRMLACKELNISAGKYLLISSEVIHQGKENIYVADKLGNIQYALAKVASIFPTEVLTDFEFYLVAQGSKEIKLANRHLVFIKGLMECYGQSIIVSGKEINSDLGAAVRYVEQDSPFLADYFLVKSANITNKLQLEKIRELYFKILERDMNSSKQLSKRAQLYRDVAALTGLTYAFVQSLESTAKKSMKIEDAEREMSKIIEQVGDAVAFCYYATLGDQDKKTVQARLYRNSDNYFIYDQAKEFLETKLQILERQEKDEAKQQTWLTFYADDVIRVYTHFAENGYAQDREWNELTYNLKLSLYTRFPELVRKLKSTSEN
ncbi:MAG: hypothetical protein V7L22_17660 [Nostoc sp.]|uniref:hypothetical protein n=1 Tax=Nostoc sp. TaxID=1180 RepID=UPI002FFA7FAC